MLNTLFLKSLYKNIILKLINTIKYIIPFLLWLFMFHLMKLKQLDYFCEGIIYLLGLLMGILSSYKLKENHLPPKELNSAIVLGLLAALFLAVPSFLEFI
jgi:hypothetical protein